MPMVLALLLLLAASPAAAQEPEGRLRDRGDGLPVSQFGSYIRKGEWLVYPFFEYYRDGNYEYEAGELGFEGTTELRSRYRAREGLLFVAYGITGNLAVEFEVARITASLDKAVDDRSLMPDQLRQSGIGDVEGQIRYRWNRESDARPEFFSYFETVAPVQQDLKLIGTPGWEFKFGTGFIRAFSWATMTVRAAVAHADGSFEPGEYAVEFLRRISSRLRIYAGVEGSQDEVELITEAQIFLRPNVYLKLNNGIGLTSKAPGWAPEVGVMISFK